MKRRFSYAVGLFVLLLFGIGGTFLVREGRRKAARDGNPQTTRENQLRSSAHRQGQGRWTAEQDEALVEDESASGDVLESSSRNSKSTRKKELSIAEMGELAQFSKKARKKVKVGHLSWKRGQSWEVESYYLQMERPGHEPEWSDDSIVWRFEVAGIEKVDGVDAYVLEVNPTDLSNMPYNPGGKVYVSVADNTILALRDKVLEAGVIRERYLKFGQPGSGAYSSLIPVELPSPGTEGYTYTGLNGAGTPMPVGSGPNIAAPKATGTVTEVGFTSNGSTILQRWDSDNPNWPIYSSTPSRVSILKKGS